jgi:hypothetical protein
MKRVMDGYQCPVCKLFNQVTIPITPPAPTLSLKEHFAIQLRAKNKLWMINHPFQAIRQGQFWAWWDLRRFFQSYRLMEKQYKRGYINPDTIRKEINKYFQRLLGGTTK